MRVLFINFFDPFISKTTTIQFFFEYLTLIIIFFFLQSNSSVQNVMYALAYAINELRITMANDNFTCTVGYARDK